MHVLGEDGVMLSKNVVQGEFLFAVETSDGWQEYNGVASNPRYALVMIPQRVVGQEAKPFFQLFIFTSSCAFLRLDRIFCGPYIVKTFTSDNT